MVIETGVSGHDIEQDFHEHGHKMTMIQRSATCVVAAFTYRANGCNQRMDQLPKKMTS